MSTKRSRLRSRASVHELPSATLKDVPTVLRAIADRIEEGQYGRPVNAVVVLETEDGGAMRLEVFAAGPFNNVHRSLSLLQLGTTQLAMQHVGHPNAGSSAAAGPGG